MTTIITVDSPLRVCDRLGWTTLTTQVDITDIAVRGEVLAFEAEHSFHIADKAPAKEIYFQSDATGEDELVFFALELRNNHIHLLPGNSGVDSLTCEVSSTALGQPVQHKVRKGAAHASAS